MLFNLLGTVAVMNEQVWAQYCTADKRNGDWMKILRFISDKVSLLFSQFLTRSV